METTVETNVEISEMKRRIRDLEESNEKGSMRANKEIPPTETHNCFLCAGVLKPNTRIVFVAKGALKEDGFPIYNRGKGWAHDNCYYKKEV